MRAPPPDRGTRPSVGVGAGLVKISTASATTAAAAVPSRAYDVYAKGEARSQASRAPTMLLARAMERQSLICGRAPMLKTTPETRAAAPTPAITHSVVPMRAPSDEDHGRAGLSLA